MESNSPTWRSVLPRLHPRICGSVPLFLLKFWEHHRQVGINRSQDSSSANRIFSCWKSPPAKRKIAPTILLLPRHWPRQPSEERGCTSHPESGIPLLESAVSRVYSSCLFWFPQTFSDLQTPENPSILLYPPPLVIPQRHVDAPKQKSVESKK